MKKNLSLFFCSVESVFFSEMKGLKLSKDSNKKAELYFRNVQDLAWIKTTLQHLSESITLEQLKIECLLLEWTLFKIKIQEITREAYDLILCNCLILKISTNTTIHQKIVI